MLTEWFDANKDRYRIPCLPSAPTEAIISLSIVFLAAEIVHKRRGVVGLTERLPWIIAFGLGIFHGLGTAQWLQTATAFTVPYVIGGIAAFWTIERSVSSIVG